MEWYFACGHVKVKLLAVSGFNCLSLLSLSQINIITMDWHI